MFGGPAKTDAELAAAVAAGALVNVESVLELRRLAGGRAAGDGRRGAAGQPGRRRPCPAATRMTGAPTPFGVDEAQLPAAVALARDARPATSTGFHLHAVSNNLDAAAHAGVRRRRPALVAWRPPRRLGIDLRMVNVGGGFGVDYTGDAAIRPGRAAAARAGPTPRLVFEPGRFLAADAGWYAAEVLDLKRTHGRWFAVLRGGTHHFRLPAAWGYSHPFTVLPVRRLAVPVRRGPRSRDAAVDAVGELCTPRDVLARGQHVDRLRVGDVLVFGRAGAYGWDISHHDFLRHPHPDVIWLVLR